ncbi:hypothetical protein DSUL_50211 [Desulfovibrionales bacterium]
MVDWSNDNVTAVRLATQWYNMDHVPTAFSLIINLYSEKYSPAFISDP